MNALSDLLNRGINNRYPDTSNRKLADLAGVSRGTIDNYRNGNVTNPTEEVLQAFHKLLGTPITELREAAGLPRGEESPYAPPAEANLLDDRQRKAVDEIIRVIVAARGALHAIPSDPAPSARAPRKAVKVEKIRDGVSPSIGDDTQTPGQAALGAAADAAAADIGGSKRLKKEG